MAANSNKHQRVGDDPYPDMNANKKRRTEKCETIRQMQYLDEKLNDTIKSMQLIVSAVKF